MKKLFITLLCVGLLSACQADSPPGQSLAQPSAEVDLNRSLDELPAKAIDCSDLKTQEYRLECEDSLNRLAGQILTQEVMETFDFARCDELPYDQVEPCKTQLSSGGIKGPITLAQAQALQVALQPTTPNLPEETLEKLTQEGGGEIEMVYTSDNCATLSQENGLRGYCEAQIEEKKQRQALSQAIGNGNQVDCSDFELESVKQECKSLINFEF